MCYVSVQKTVCSQLNNIVTLEQDGSLHMMELRQGKLKEHK